MTMHDLYLKLETNWLDDDCYNMHFTSSQAEAFIKTRANEIRAEPVNIRSEKKYKAYYIILFRRFVIQFSFELQFLIAHRNHPLFDELENHILFILMCEACDNYD